MWENQNHADRFGPYAGALDRLLSPMTVTPAAIRGAALVRPAGKMGPRKQRKRERQNKRAGRLAARR